MDKKRQDRKTGGPDRERRNRTPDRRREGENRETRVNDGNRERRGGYGTRENRGRRETRENREQREARDLRERWEQEPEADGVIEGRNAVIEALRSGAALDKVYIQKGETDRTLGHIASKAREAGAVVVDADRRKLDVMSRTHAHQGVIALTSVREYVPVEDLLARAEARGEPPLLVVCDGITDPGNLGAILRAAECAGAHGVILPKRRSAGLTAVTAKTSAGAVAHIPAARVANLPALLKELKKQGVWVYGAAAEGTAPLYRTDLKGPAAIVIGSEGEGLSRLVRETCDALVSIPLRGKVESLNAGAAAAVLLYEAVRQRYGDEA
ncbi:MAG: 23S rRNA (guanosine(2251)-2'-O)-methyltransferase RlmB [Oscillibacter sp.]|nr:23S rRNA (guanosine(2251)-2'-O)-methyltransferase RlmB [Oscillibacter sp.]